MSRYLFIDGAYLEQVLLDMGNEWFGGASMTPQYQSISGSVEKVFYYDCLPPRLPAESDEQYNAKKAPKEALFEQLRNLDGWHVSEGIAKHRKRQGAQLKEVDILA